MDTSQRAEFDAELESLFGAWGRLYSAQLQSGYWKGLAKMALGELTRTVQRAIEQFADDPDMKLPTVGVLWQIRRSLRTGPAPASEQKAVEPAMDPWMTAANLHLITEVRRRVLHYAPDSYARKDPATGRMRSEGGPETCRRTWIAIEWKNAWARDMRDAQDNDAIPPDGGKAWWQDCMRKAEVEMGKV